MNEMNPQNAAQETAACCCVDVGAIIDNSDCTAVYTHQFDNRQQAELALAQLTQKAREIESEPCLIDSRQVESADGVTLECRFTFSCQAENVIFQLGLR